MFYLVLLQLFSLSNFFWPTKCEKNKGVVKKINLRQKKFSALKKQMVS